VNSGNLDCLLERLVKISYFGLDFLNTFLLTFPLFTNAHTVLDHLEKNYWDCLRLREKRRGSVSPLDAVRDARGGCGYVLCKEVLILSAHVHTVIQTQGLPRSGVVGNVGGGNGRQLARHLNLPVKARATTMPASNRKSSDPTPLLEARSASVDSPVTIKNVSGVLFALKHWICKHFYVRRHRRGKEGG
jgi:hypothetical protein